MWYIALSYVYCLIIFYNITGTVDMDSWELFYTVVYMSVNCYKTLKNCLALAYKVVCVVSFLGKDPRSRIMNLNYKF